MNSDRPRHRQRRVRSAHAGLAAHGEPWVWLTAGSLATALAMIVGLLGFIVARGAATFWPAPLELVELADGGRMLGEVTERERIEQTGENGPVVVPRRLLRTANQDIDGVSSVWVDDRTIEKTARPEWASVIERMETGRFHGFPTRLWQGTKLVADGPEAAWRAFEREHPAIRGRFRRALSIDKHDRGVLQRELRTARLAVVQAGLDAPSDSARRERAAANEREVIARVGAATQALDAETARLRGENEGWELECETASGEAKRIPLAAIVRGWQPNRLSLSGKAGVYLSRWGEFLGDDPREANSAGGVFPAIWGTVAMTLIMSLLVAPFGVLAALYLREYASRGPITTAVRVAINNLAGVPSIVYGAFGLGFFCYGLGGRIDELFFKASLVADGQPTFGTGGLLWASLTLALLTLPVVIVDARGFLRLRRRQVADDPTDRPPPGPARHHDGADPGDGPRRRRGGPADARGREEGGPRPADRRHVSLRPPGARVHAPRLPDLRRRLPEPGQPGSSADGVHDHAPLGDDHRPAQRGRHLDPFPAAAPIRRAAVLRPDG